MNLIDRDTFNLSKGAHSDGPPPGDPDCELCFWEAYNILTLTLPSGPSFVDLSPEDIEITDRCPADVSPVLHRMAMRLNDALPDDKRQQLKLYLPNGVSPLAGTFDDGLDETRRWMAVNWTVRVALPVWLDAAGCIEQAAELRALPPITDQAGSDAARPLVRTIRDEARRRRDEWRKELRAKITAKLAEQPVAVADADADADAAAAAVADAVADAAVAAAVVADADADAVAVVVAVADVAAAVAAVAAIVAAIVADAAADGRYWTIRAKVYDAVRASVQERYQPTIDALQDSAINLYAAMVRPEVVA